MMYKFLIVIFLILATTVVYNFTTFFKEPHWYLIPPFLFFLVVWSSIVRGSLKLIPISEIAPPRHDDMTIFSQRVSTLVAFSLIAFFCILGLLGIGKQTLVDEPLWVFDRIESYAHEIVDGNLRDSRPSDKPGLTNVVLSSVALIKYPRPSLLKETITPAVREDMLVWMRVPILLGVVALLIFFYRFLRKLIGTDIALIALVFVTLSSILLGMSRIINPDALLWLLLPSTLVTFLLAVQYREKRTILYTGIFFGLSLLTKYISNILLIFFPLVILFYLVLDKTNNREKITTDIRALSRVYFIVVSLGVLLYALLLPSTWVYPIHLLKGTVLSQAFGPLGLPYLFVILASYYDVFLARKSRIVGAIMYGKKYSTFIAPALAVTVLASIGLVFLTAHANVLFDYYVALRSPKSAPNTVGHTTIFFTGFYVLIFAISIPMLLGGCYGLFRLMTLRDPSRLWYLSSFSAFIIFYYIGHVVSGVTPILRYQIVLFPLFAIIAAFGVYMLIEKINDSMAKRVVFGLLVGILILGVVSVRPYYMSYNNGLLPQGQILNIKDMGDGNYQAAQYLNSKPDASSLSVWSDKAGVCAAFVGKCATTTNVGNIAQRNLEFDYYVVSRGKRHLISREAQHNRGRKAAPDRMQVFESLYKEEKMPEYEFSLGNNPANYIRVFGADAIEYVSK